MYYTNKRRPCRICGRDHGCSWTDDGLILCRRTQGEVSGFRDLGPSRKDPAWNLYREEGTCRSDCRPPRTIPLVTPIKTTTPATAPPKKKEEATDKPSSFDQVKHALPDLVAKAKAEGYHRNLARKLGVLESLVQEQGVGIIPDGWREAYRTAEGYVLPERDAHGEIVGIKIRQFDGEKIYAKGSATHGAYYLDNPLATLGPVFIGEGGSDMLALATMGRCAICRSSLDCSFETLVEMLKDLSADRPIIVVAELDQKADGKWPGKTGAMRMAKRLADALGRPVLWALPPDEAKDSRDFLNRNMPRQPSLFDIAELEALGDRFEAEMLAAAAPPEMDDDPFAPGPIAATPASTTTSATAPPPAPVTPATPTTTTPPPVILPKCPHVSRHVLSHRTELRGGVGVFACKSRFCAVCGPQRKREWLDDAAERVGEASVLGRPIHRWVGPKVQWEGSGCKFVSRHGGGALRIRSEANADLVIVYTDIALEGVAPLPSYADALAKIEDDLREVSPFTEKPVTFSGTWKRTKAAKGPAQWNRMGTTAAPQSEVRKIVVEEGCVIDRRAIISREAVSSVVYEGDVCQLGAAHERLLEYRNVRIAHSDGTLLMRNSDKGPVSEDGWKRMDATWESIFTIARTIAPAM